MDDNKIISKIDSTLTLDKVRYRNEYQYLERKGLHEERIKPTKLANEIIGILNAGGGVLVFGVAENGDITDLKQLDEPTLNQYRTLYVDLIKPPANVNLEEVVLESGELIFIYHVSMDAERLFCRSDNEDVFLRIADKNKGPLDREEVRVLEYDKEIRKYEEELRPDFDFNDLDRELIGWFKEDLNFEGSDEELLLARKLAANKDGSTVINNAGILLFSHDPDKYITNAKVRYVRYEGSEALTGEELNVIKDEEFLGNIPTLIEQLKEFVYASLRDYYYLDIEVGKFIKISEYPRDAWLEGIVNALCHRSYNVQGNCVYIKHFDDRLEITNSGPLPAQVTIENIQTERYARNPRIARVLSEMGHVRELNEGVPRIYKSMARSMLAEPEYSTPNNNVRLLLRNKVTGHQETISDRVMKLIEFIWDDLNETQREIIVFLFNRYHATLPELTKHLGITETAVRGYLNTFCGQGILQRNSEKTRDKNAEYTFKKSFSDHKKS